MIKGRVCSFLFFLLFLFFFGFAESKAESVESSFFSRIEKSNPKGKSVESSSLDSESEDKSVFDKKFVFEENPLSIDKDDEDIVNAPPTFPGGENYNPGGQVSPLPIANPLPFLLVLSSVYMTIYWRNRRK